MTHTVSIQFTDQQLRDIIGNAASIYWLSHNFSRRSDGSIEIHQAYKREMHGESVINSIVGPEQIATALQTLQAGNKGSRRIYCEVLNDCDEHGCAADGPTCDCVLQVAVFGKIVFA